MKHNAYTHIFASKTQPNPAMDVIWMDLDSDPRGSVLKFWNGESYIPMALGNAGDFGDALSSIVNQIAQAKAEAYDEAVEYTDDILASLDLSGYMKADASNSDVESLLFNLSPEDTAALYEGELRWNSANGTIDLGLGGNGPTHSIGLNFYHNIQNNSGADIKKGNLVMYAGGTSTNNMVFGALASPGCEVSDILGIATSDVLNGQSGYVARLGMVDGLKTSVNGLAGAYSEVWAAGDYLYQSTTHSGALTNVKPGTTSKAISIARVAVAHATKGSLLISISKEVSLSDATDLNITSPVDGELLVANFDGTNLVWENRHLNADDIEELPNKRFYSPIDDSLDTSDFVVRGTIDSLVELMDVVDNDEVGIYVLRDTPTCKFKMLDSDGVKYTSLSGDIALEFLTDTPIMIASSSTAQGAGFYGAVSGYVSTIQAEGSEVHLVLSSISVYGDAKDSSIRLSETIGDMSALESDVNSKLFVLRQEVSGQLSAADLQFQGELIAFGEQIDNTVEHIEGQMDSKADGARVDEDGSLWLTSEGFDIAGPIGNKKFYLTETEYQLLLDSNLIIQDAEYNVFE